MFMFHKNCRDEYRPTGWPKKVSHYQIIKIVLNRIKACQ